MLISFLGDFKSKIGKRRVEDFVGEYDLEKWKENGYIIVQFVNT